MGIWWWTFIPGLDFLRWELRKLWPVEVFSIEQRAKWQRWRFFFKKRTCQQIFFLKIDASCPHLYILKVLSQYLEKWRTISQNKTEKIFFRRFSLKKAILALKKTKFFSSKAAHHSYQYCLQVSSHYFHNWPRTKCLKMEKTLLRRNGPIWPR